MNLIRFMGSEELEKYIHGDVLHNKTVWREEGSRSDSVGFCFFDTSAAPEERMPYLTGLVDMSVVAEFEPVPETVLKESYGIYRDPAMDDFTILNLLSNRIPRQRVLEYSTTSYSRKTMKLIRIGIPDMFRHSISWKKECDWK